MNARFLNYLTSPFKNCLQISLFFYSFKHLFVIFIIVINIFSTLVRGNVPVTTAKTRCYSCASENMKENFLTRSRGPKEKKIAEPRLYDNLCDLDSWMIREKSSEDCLGTCFKWQQILNNSGVLSYATIRGCYSKMFDAKLQSEFPFDVEADVAFELKPKINTLNLCRTNAIKLTCIDQSQLEEFTCWCQGDYCNVSLKLMPLPLITLTLFIITLAKLFFL